MDDSTIPGQTTPLQAQVWVSYFNCWSVADGRLEQTQASNGREALSGREAIPPHFSLSV